MLAVMWADSNGFLGHRFLNICVVYRGMLRQPTLQSDGDSTNSLGFLEGGKTTLLSVLTPEEKHQWIFGTLTIQMSAMVVWVLQPNGEPIVLLQKKTLCTWYRKLATSSWGFGKRQEVDLWELASGPVHIK